ncbi:HNH endonuclease signature motif containing protein [Achromobacter ruhlandii]|uniref:HNH endonuclease signature motif containing protein n=1 Tax=Achromobacter ruhlandii TaxID=72557 RepID=UPI003BA29696
MSSLTQERLKQVLHYDPLTGKFMWMSHRKNSRIGTEAGYSDRTKRIKILVDGSQYFAHRLAWLYVHGSWPSGVIDHIDGNPGNNVLSNLRDVSVAINSQNRRHPRSESKTGVLGVFKKNGHFFASISVNDKTRHLGVFETVEEAHAAYVKAKRILHPGCTL